jgi:predicted ABC-class ATPase
LLFRNDLLNLEAQEPEMLYEADEQQQIEIENHYAELLKSWVAMPEEIRNVYNKMISEVLIEHMNEKKRKEVKND